MPRTAALSLTIPCLLAALAAGSPTLAGPDPLPAPLPGLSPDRLFPGAVFDPAIPDPASVLGFHVGGRPARHGEIVRYYEALAEASPRARIETYARTHEGRELLLLAVSDEETVARLDAFRDEHRRRMDPRGRADGEDEALLRGARAVAWMAYSIHGDELSSADAALALAYWLVAGEDDAARMLRRELVILIDPVENPDGRERFLAQTTSFAHAVPSPDLEDLSHTTVWPWGRGNHYLFDLNRDWFSQVHPESERSTRIASWNPQLMVDSHEMGSDDTYLFSPPRHPFNPHQPESLDTWRDVFASDQARALDGRGYGYYTREWNEEFFPGYGSSWAKYRGAVGILYEMASTNGTLVRQRAGVERTYAQAVEHQVASSVANLTTLATNRRQVLADFVAQRRASMKEAREGAVRAWLFPPGAHPDRTRGLARRLLAQGIEVERSRERVDGKLLRDIRTGESRTLSLPAGTFLVRLDQPATLLARVLLDPHVPMEAGFLSEEREYIERGKGSRLYDTTAWSLPLLYGVEAYWTGTVPGAAWEAVTEVEERPAEIAPAPDRVFAWLVDAGPDAVGGALASLLQRKVPVRVADKPFSVAGRSYPRGTLLVKREGGPEDLAAVMSALAGDHGVGVAAVPTALAESGPDLGGRHFRALVPPRVGVLTGMPVAPDRYGAIWRLLDLDVGLRFTAVDVGGFARLDLRRYNVLVFPPVMGGPETYGHLLGKEGLERLASWIRGGGTAIGIGTGAQFLAAKDTGLTRTRLRREALDRFPPEVLGLTAREAADAGLFRAVGTITGADAGDGRKAADGSVISPYDVAPVLGPGARPFARGYDLGTPASLTPIPMARWLAPVLPGDDAPPAKAVERADRRLRGFSTRGTLVRAELDPEHWLAWGAGDEVDVLLRTGTALVAEPPVEVAARFPEVDRIHLGGLLWPELAGRLALTAYVTREAAGQGQVVLFLDEPEIRGWTVGTRRLLVNAILMGPGLGTSWSRPW